jgi:hypothetical protein
MANIFNLQLPEDGYDICVICQENLLDRQSYKLPECGHEFHTDCIVTWFRHRPSSNDEMMPDGSCPCCNNKGINHISKPRRYWSHSHLRNEYFKSRLKMLRVEEKKPNCPKELKRLFKKLNTEKENLKNVLDEQQKYKLFVKDTNVNFEETRRKLSYFRNARWNKQRAIMSLTDAIVFFPIINIIIPTRIEI